MELPVRRRELLVDGMTISVSYVDAGHLQSNAALLLVHGLGGRWQHWLKVIPPLSQHRRVIAVDLPGFGETTLPWPTLTLPRIADVIARLLAELQVERVIFVGHSFGGPLASIFAARHPRLTEQLVLAAGTVQSFQQTLSRELRPWLLRPRSALATVAEVIGVALKLPTPAARLVARSRLLRLLALWPFVHQPGRLTAEDALLLIEGTGAPGVFPTTRGIARAKGWENETIDVPVALVNGDHDLIAPLADLRSYRGRADHVIVIKQTGHLAMIERPEAFTAALEGVIAGGVAFRLAPARASLG